MALNAPGIGSGLDVNGIVAQLMALERRPLSQLDQREAGLQAKLSQLGLIKNTLSSFQAAARGLTPAAETRFKAATSDSTVLTASADTSAATGTHSVVITALAQSHKLVATGQSSKTAAIGAGTDTTLTLAFGTISIGVGSFDSNTGKYTGASFTAHASRNPYNVVIGSTNNTLEGIRDAINASGAGVTATIVNDGGSSPYRLALSVNDSGVANSLKITVAGDAALQTLLAHDPAATQNLSQTQSAQNAAFTVNGVTVSKSVNTVTDAIPGVTLGLVKNGTATVTVSRDATAIQKALDALVKAYNEVNKTIKTATADKAVLQGEGAPLGVLSQLRGALGASAPGMAVYPTLSQLGVRFQKDGSLSLDTAQLQAAVDANHSAVAATVASFGKTLTTTADSLVSAAGGVSARTTGINRVIADIGSRRSTVQHRLELVEQRYRKQFAALDGALAGMSQTSAYLQQQLQNLPKPGSSS